jgi:hypothetical protein
MAFLRYHHVRGCLETTPWPGIDHWSWIGGSFRFSPEKYRVGSPGARRTRRTIEAAVAWKLYRPAVVSPLAQRVADAIRRNGSGVVLCFGCLAAQQGLKEHDVRAVALVLVVRAGLQIARRRCSSCRRVDEALVAQKAA